MADPEASLVESYRAALGEYLHTRSEEPLYQASLLSRRFVQEGVGPEEIVALHADAIAIAMSGRSYREQARATTDGLQFLLEMMIAYGMQHQNYLELRLAEIGMQAEQQTALERQRADLAEQSEREKVELLGVIAHELGTPLTAVKGYVDVATRLIKRGRFEAVPSALGTASDAIDRLSQLTGDLVRASRGELIALEMQPLALESVVEQAAAWANVAALEKEIQLEYQHARTSLPVWISGNADALLTILGNLLSNAIRYTPNGGCVTIRSGLHDGQGCVSVTDSGIGMTEAVQARIFEKFYRAPEARHVEAGGLGLGLTLAHELVVAHGGEIRLVSEPGAGSTFTVCFPLASTPGNQATGGMDERPESERADLRN
ncbi:MAG TPA: ATP-binding protein [Chloroflexota bacterium]|jgi:signal transduction histidine kinase|nr:ATP-binding protein [Chloroflexota bacterium]